MLTPLGIFLCTVALVADRLNVLVILTDSQRTGAIRHAGNSNNKLAARFW